MAILLKYIEENGMRFLKEDSTDFTKNQLKDAIENFEAVFDELGTSANLISILLTELNDKDSANVIDSVVKDILELGTNFSIDLNDIKDKYEIHTESLTEAINKPTVRAFILDADSEDMNGDWVDFPISEEQFEETLDNLGIKNFDVAEVELSGYDNDDVLGLLGQSDYDALNNLAHNWTEFIENNHDINALEAVLETSPLETAVADIVNGAVEFWPNITDYESLGKELTEIHPMLDMEPSNLEEYLDLYSLGEWLDEDPYEDENGNRINAGQFFCNDPTADFEDIATEVVRQGYLDENDLEPFFDYSAYGQRYYDNNDCTFTEHGMIEYV